MLTDMGSILSGLPKGEGPGEINKRERVYGQHFQARIFKKRNQLLHLLRLQKDLQFTLIFVSIVSTVGVKS